MEVTAREQTFAPEEYYLSYIRVKGFIMEDTAGVFPFPERGSLSTTQGHHWIIEDNTLRRMNSLGLDCGGQGGFWYQSSTFGYHLIRRNIFEDMGICGLAGPSLQSTLVEDNVFERIAWHNVESLAECAAISLHHSVNTIIRRNIVRDVPYGCGIYIDSFCINTRITQNTVVNCGSNHGPDGIGGIYIEASQGLNMIDNNFIFINGHLFLI